MKGSRGILEGLSMKKDHKKEDTLKEDVEELSVKRSYSLKPSTVRKLQEMKVFIYDDPSITFNEIVDEAICKLYDDLKNSSK